MPIEVITGFGHERKLFEQGRIAAREIETGFPLHPAAQAIGYVPEQLGVHVDGHQVVADIAFFYVNVNIM